MIFDTGSYPPSINIVWIPIGILMLSHAVRGTIRGKFEGRGSIRCTRDVAECLRAEGVDCRRRGQDRRAREEGGGLKRASFRLEDAARFDRRG
jgi:hypothetical protein